MLVVLPTELMEVLVVSQEQLQFQLMEEQVEPQLEEAVPVVQFLVLVY